MLETPSTNHPSVPPPRLRTRSPRPVTCTSPPSMMPGTSDPTSAASSTSSFALRRAFHAALSPTSAAAASALPPPRPAATGIDLWTTIVVGLGSAFSARSAAAERVAERLAPVSERRPHEPEERLGIGNVDGRRVATNELDEDRAHVRRRQKYRGRYIADDASLGTERNMDCGGSVGAAARRGRPTLAELLLDHDQPAGYFRYLIEDPQQERRGDVVRKVGDEPDRLPDECGDVRPHRICDDELDIAEIAGHLPKRGSDLLVDLDGDDAACRFRQDDRQGAETRPDLENRVVACNAREPDDLADRVRVDEEVLTVPPTGAQPVAAEHVGGDGRGHVLEHATIVLLPTTGP